MAKIKNKKLEIIISYILLFIGCVIEAFCVDNFLLYNDILDGGITGVSMIIINFIPISLSLVVFILNLPFVYLGYKSLGYEFLCKMLFSSFIFSVFLEIFKFFPPITTDILLACVFGGFMIGVGLGLTINFGGSTDGLDSLAVVINRKYDISVGKITLIFNACIFLISGFIFGFDKAFYAIIRYFITFKTIDYISDIMQNTKAVMIITNDGDKVSKEIYKLLGRTTTKLEGHGLVSGKKDVLYCVISRIELYQLKKLIENEFDNTFVTVSNIENIYGNFVKSKTLDI